MFYPDWTTEELRHVAQITDTRQYSTPSLLWSSSGDGDASGDVNVNNDAVVDDSNNGGRTESTATSATTNTTTRTLVESERRRNRGLLRKKPPMWSLKPRSDFVVDDKMFMALYGSEASAMVTLSYDSLINLGGAIQVPLTGVMHIVANGVVPVTLSIICDNELDTWSLTVNGLNCELNNLLQ